MGTGYTRNDTGNNIADGNVINASDLDGEFDALEDAFDGSTGHSHDGTTGEGPQIDTAGLANDAVTGAKIDSTTTVTAASFVGPLTGAVTGNVTGDLTGNADTATALETPRTIGGVSFDGSANINLPGVNTAGNQDTTGNAATATALETARTIAGQSFDGTGNISIAPGDLTGVTASAAELNILDGATVTTAEVNILDGATVTTAEVNILDGATVTTAEINRLDGTLAEVRTTLELGTTDDVQFDSFGVGTAASGTTGEIRATNNVTAFYSSDIRLKENIVPITDALDKVNQISGVTYDWTDAYIESHGGEDGHFIRKHDVGVIAQEIEAVLPEIVGENSEGYKAVKYDRLVSLLIEAVKELSAKVEKLEAN